MRRNRFSVWLVVLVVGAGSAVPAFAQGQRAVIEAVERTVLSSEVNARVRAMPRREGESFDAGDPLVQLDCAIYESEYDKVQAQLQQARRTLQNKQRLSELDSVGDLEVELARLDVREAEAERDIVARNVERCTIDAPYDGRVVERKARQYQSVERQQELLEIVGNDMEARIIVPSTWLAWLERGDRVELTVDETGITVPGTVSRIGAAIDPVSHTVPIWAALETEDASLRPGMSGSAHFPARPEQARSATADEPTTADER